MTTYIIKSVTSMVVLYGLYWLLLRKVKMFRFNRYYLIISVLFSLVIPLLTLPVYVGNKKTTNEVISRLYNIPERSYTTSLEKENKEKAPVITTAQPPEVAEEIKNKTIDINNVLLVIYFSGCVVMFFRFGKNIMVVKRLLRKSEKIDNQWYTIALLEQKINPFSFLSTIFLYSQDYRASRIADNILRHEIEHVRQWHSFDIIFFEMIHIIFWFNPVVLLIKRAARINHEYLADEAVVRSIPDTKSYALDLINFISRRISVPITSGFNPSTIRLRLLMLNTDPDHRSRNIRIFVTTFIAVVLSGFLCVKPAYTIASDQKSKTGIIQDNQDIVIDELNFRGHDFMPMNSLVVLNGEKLGMNDTVIIDPSQIKYIHILTKRRETRKYGKEAKNGVIEIDTYDSGRAPFADSSFFKPLYTLNDDMHEGRMSIPVSNLYSFSIWTYPIFPNQDLNKRWRVIDILTRDYFTIRGRVVKTNGEPLPGVHVAASENPSRIVTDNDGRFLLRDVQENATAEISAEGYKGIDFIVKRELFKRDMNIAFYRMDEPDPDSITLVKHALQDFSGAWQLDKELSKTAGYDDLTYVISQFDSDSISINMTFFSRDKEYKHTMSYPLNTVRTFLNETRARKSVLAFVIEPDGRSFSVIEKSRSILGINQNYKTVETFSINSRGDRMEVYSYTFDDTDSSTGKEYNVLVFTRI